ncbi:MAG: ABC transporter ATP-binding protein, partial [Urechidicola sp.]|nr:ABC transporter ATP-binding protein [Urechidicola sp.]
MIVVESITKKYKGTDFYSVAGLNLEIKQGEIFGLLGPNGAGKTTLISMLCGLLKPTSGSVAIDELNFRDNKKKLQYLIGVVPQEYALYPTLTAYENLLYFGAMYGLKGKKLKNNIEQSLESL